MLRARIAVVSAALLCAGLAPAAQATDPGRDGSIVTVVQVGRPGSSSADTAPGLLAAAAEPDWSADGRVAFTSGPDIYNGRSDIYAGPPAGPFRRLTFRGGSAPSWSPHGRWIAFARKGTVYVVPSRGGKARRVVAASKGWPASHLTHTVSPVWSPDGKRIAFYRAIERGADTYLDLYSVDWRTKKLRRVAKGLTSDGTYDDSAVDRLVWQALP